jgi:hypothetical protein
MTAGTWKRFWSGSISNPCSIERMTAFRPLLKFKRLSAHC